MLCSCTLGCRFSVERVHPRASWPALVMPPFNRWICKEVRRDHASLTVPGSKKGSKISPSFFLFSRLSARRTYFFARKQTCFGGWSRGCRTRTRRGGGGVPHHVECRVTAAVVVVGWVVGGRTPLHTRGNYGESVEHCARIILAGVGWNNLPLGAFWYGI